MQHIARQTRIGSRVGRKSRSGRIWENKIGEAVGTGPIGEGNVVCSRAGPDESRWGNTF